MKTRISVYLKGKDKNDGYNQAMAAMKAWQKQFEGTWNEIDEEVESFIMEIIADNCFIIGRACKDTLDEIMGCIYASFDEEDFEDFISEDGFVVRFEVIK